MLRHTALHPCHLETSAHLTAFAGWEMPLHYGSQLEEHHAVRRTVGLFDVSHMSIADLSGEGAVDFLRTLLANDIAKAAQPGQSLYSCLLNERGGVIDDLIVYTLGDDRFRIVSNAATRDKVLAWLRQQAQAFRVTVTAREDLAMLALQGPESPQIADTSVMTGTANLPNRSATWKDELFIARTGYTGEDGFEIILPQAQAPALWRRLNERGARACGLAARDTLRLEAGMLLYGADMDEWISPLQCGLGWTVAWHPEERRFIGRSALERQQQEGPPLRFVGLVLEDKGVLRSHQQIVVDGEGEGIITSGGFSPTLGRAIALARLPAGVAERCLVNIRETWKPARIVKPRFVRFGKPLIAL